MKTSDDGIALIEEREGIKLEMYRDSAGLPTIGVGHLLTKDELSSGKLRIDGYMVDWHQGLTEEQVKSLLMNDLEDAEFEVRQLIDVELTQEQYDCLVSFTFNAGGHALADSTLRKRLNGGDYGSVPLELRRWIHSAGKVDPKLQTRRESEIIQWNSSAPVHGLAHTIGAHGEL